MIGTSRKPACANYDHPDCPGYPEISGKSGNLRKSPESPEKNSYSAIQIVTRFLSFSLNGCTREPFEL